MSILRIILHIIIVILLALGWILYLRSTKPNFENGIKQLWLFFKKNWRGILWVLIYLTLSILSTIFVITNWDKCLNIQFFDNFNGYNIIWILWMILLFMPLISVDNQWFKIPNPIAKGQEQIEKAKEEASLQEVINKLNKLENDVSNTKKEDNSNGYGN
ncbi:MAG: hypothetical protein IJE43_26170 [Alphaproteobacteria bacterium]|nr:hypothetical protein [Alphaproteobacteria bacterium]